MSPHPNKIWVLVADSSRARLLGAAHRAAPLQEMEDLVHTEGRLHPRDITSDLPGRAFDRHGQGRHAYEPPTDPKEKAALEFARAVAHELEKARQEGRFERLHVVAAPEFLGLLRQHLHEATKAHIASESPRDLTTASIEQIRSALPDFL
jgi:protein required for attachment to host cells